MSDVLQVKCRSCGARTSGIRTEFGSLVVPGQEKCPRCGSTEFVEVADEEASTGTGTETEETDDAEAPAGTDPRSASERTVESETGTASDTRE